MATEICPGRQSMHWLLSKPLYNGNGHYSASPTAKITSQQQPRPSVTEEKVKNGHEIWSVGHVDD